jgi:hypothetical protein
VRLAIGILLLIGVIVTVSHCVEKADDKANQEIGATGERERTLTTNLEKTEKANEAADRLRRDPDAARAECLRNARNPADC